MSMALVNAVTKLGKRVEELEKDNGQAESFGTLNQLSEISARVEELTARFDRFSETINKTSSALIMRIEQLEQKVSQLEAKRKPGRPRKDER